MEVEIPVEHVSLKGDLIIPPGAGELVIFAHGSGSSRLSSRNRMVAEKLLQEGFGTLLFDLLTTREDMDRTNRFDITLITDRLVEVTRWVKEKSTRHLQLGYFGASTGAAAALMAAAKLKDDIKAVVSRGGRPDLAGPALPYVQAPTLLIVGGLDDVVIDLNEQAFAAMQNNEKKMIIIEGATHLFEEPGKLESVAVMAVQWFNQHLKGIMVKG